MSAVDQALGEFNRLDILVNSTSFSNKYIILIKSQMFVYKTS